MEKVYSCLGRSLFLNGFNSTEENCQNDKEIFAAILTHDLKTPTIAQIRSLEIILSGALGSFNEEQKEMLFQTLESCKNMYAMINNVLSAYKYERQNKVLLNKVFNFYNLAKECCVEFSRYADTKGQNIALQCNLKNIFVEADEVQLKYAIKNILLESLSRGYPNTKINVVLEKEKNGIVFAVKCQSPNITKEVLNNVFKKYPCGTAKYNKVGSSLRLYLARRIISAHDGLMLASSENNISMFGFVIPVCKNKFN